MRESFTNRVSGGKAGLSTELPLPSGRGSSGRDDKAMRYLPNGRESYGRDGKAVRRVRKHTKDRGDMAEMQFMLDAAQRGFGVAKPYGDNEHYDVVVDSGKRLWRVQVKSTASTHHRGFSVRSSWRSSRRQIAYTEEDVDFLAVRIAGCGIWYVIPVRALGGRLTIHLYPFGSRKGGKRRFEKYREAWELLGTCDNPDFLRNRNNFLHPDPDRRILARDKGCSYA